MKPWFYLPAGPKVWCLKGDSYPVGEYHHSLASDTVSFLWPVKVSRVSINPHVFQGLKKHLSVTRIWIVDRATGINKPAFVADHINRSGANYLVGNTFSDDYPTFPDSGKIYSYPEKQKGKVVVTVGGSRFDRSIRIGTQPICEWVGLVAPVWSYIKVPVTAVATPAGTDIKSVINKVLESK